MTCDPYVWEQIGQWCFVEQWLAAAAGVGGGVVSGGEGSVGVHQDGEVVVGVVAPPHAHAGVGILRRYSQARHRSLVF